MIDDKGVHVTYHDIAAVQQRIADVIGRRTLVVSLCRNSIGAIAEYAAENDKHFVVMYGQKKRFLKIYGNRVNLDEIDRMIKSQFRDIKKFVVTKTKLNPAAYKVIAIDKIPHNDAGKVLYAELKKYY